MPKPAVAVKFAASRWAPSLTRQTGKVGNSFEVFPWGGDVD
jgi:hypothetical protein